MWRLFAPRPLKKARRAMHPSWVIEDAIVRSMRGGRRRRRRSAPRGWQGTGEAFTPDGRHVRFQCGHHHRTQAAMLECVPRRQAQIERGSNLHLVTRVLDTPESRQRDAERAEQKAMRQQAARQQRAELSEAARQRVGRWEAARQARAQRVAARREALPAERHARRAARLGWPGWGNIAASAAFLTGIVLAWVAGSNAHSPLATAGALLVMLSIGMAAVCVPVALWRKFQARKRAGTPEP
jgi:hypothetical protein